jgi:putative transposase
MVERFIPALKEQCISRHRSESLSHDSHVILGWIPSCNDGRPHQVLRMKALAEAYASVA